MKRLLASLILSLFLLTGNASAVSTVLPNSAEVKDMSATACRDFIKGLEHKGELLQEVSKQDEKVLGCAIKSGYMKFWMVPFFITRALNFIIGLSGLISVLMVMVGAFFYIAGGINEDKEKGKTVITYAIGGFVLTTLSWAIVNGILLLLTA